MEVIKTFAKNSGMSHRSLAEQFGCGRTQIGKFLKDSVHNVTVSVKCFRNSEVSRVSEFKPVNKALYEWYVLVSSKNLPRRTRAKAKEIAE